MLKNFPPELSLAGVFYRDRDKWIEHVMERDDIHATARLIGCWIAMRINRKTRDTWHQESTIAERLNVSVRTVIRAIRQLEDEKLILVKREGRRGIKSAVNHYEMIYPWHST